MIGKIKFILLAVLFLTGFNYSVMPQNAHAQQQVMGCCQFEGDEPGCWYPADPASCANLEGKYLEGEKCDADMSYCTGYKKDTSGSSESDK